LFAADLTKESAIATLKRTESESRERESQVAIFDYAETLVNGYLSNEEIPSEVAIAEAVALASELSTEESPKFINGILARLAKDRQGL
jgi:N utilization substance protein B